MYIIINFIDRERWFSHFLYGFSSYFSFVHAKLNTSTETSTTVMAKEVELKNIYTYNACTQHPRHGCPRVVQSRCLLYDVRQICVTHCVFDAFVLPIKPKKKKKLNEARFLFIFSLLFVSSYSFCFFFIFLFNSPTEYFSYMIAGILDI